MFFNEVPSMPDSYISETDLKKKTITYKDKAKTQAKDRIIHSKISMKKDEAIYLFKTLLDKLEENNND